jgi:hypothetical protein
MGLPDLTLALFKGCALHQLQISLSVVKLMKRYGSVQEKEGVT